MKKIVPPVLLLFFLLLVWFFVARFEWVSSFLVPSPRAVLDAFTELGAELFWAAMSTLKNSLWGLLLSFVVGSFVAGICSLSNFLKRALMPLAVFFQTVPLIAIAPLLVIWFGFGDPTVRMSAFLVSLFPILANVMMGLDSGDPAQREMLSSFGFSRRDLFWKWQIPSSLPYVYAGLKVASGLAVIGAIVGEFVGGGGLGSVIDSARTQQRIDIVFATVITASVLGIVFVFLLQQLAKSLQKWRPYFYTQQLES